MPDKIRRQILSNETLNSKGYHVLNDSIDWTRYRKNPILLRNRSNGDHYGMPVGHIEANSIALDNGRWVGNIVFDDTEAGMEAQVQYDSGSLNAVSIFGMARIVTRGGRKVTSYFEVWEISLVNIPSNPDAVAIRESTEGLSAVDFYCEQEEYETVEALSAKQIAFINKFESTMEENKETTKPEGIESPKDEVVSLSALDRIGEVFLKLLGKQKKSVEALDAEVADKPDEAEQGLSAEQTEKAESEKEDVETKQEVAEVETKEGLTATEQPNQTEEKEEPKIEVPTGLSVSETANIFDIKEPTKTRKQMTVPFSKYMENADNLGKLQKIASLSASADTNDGIVALSAAEEGDIRADVQELAASMMADSDFMNITKNITFQINDGRKVPVHETLQGLASGHTAAQYIENADLARITMLSIFIRQLFPDDGWASRVRRVSVRDTAGVIWTESAMNPEVYFGDRAPVNAKNYLYDDLPRGMPRKVFALQPILWQSANTDILRNNDRATGQAEALAIMSTMIHNYWLQRIAEEVPASNHVLMSGEAFDSAGRFPINPAAAGQLHGLAFNDITGVQGRFLSRNLSFTRGSGVLVTSEPYYTALATSDMGQTILSAQYSNVRPDGFTYSGFDVRIRSMIAGFNTATNTVVDAEKYFDKPVDWATGAIDDSHVPPVLAATVYDIALAMIPEEVIVGIGNTNIHMVSDPNSYGWKMSMDISTAASTLRSSSTGIALLRPTIV